VSEARPDPDWWRHQQRSRALTREIAVVLHEISAVLTVPLDQRGDDWAARASGVRQRKAALIAEVEALAAAPPVERAPCGPPRTPSTRTAGPEVVS